MIWNDKRSASLRLDAKLWRYIDLIKLTSLISSKSLYFCHPALLGDPLEGYVPLESAFPAGRSWTDMFNSIEQAAHYFRAIRGLSYVSCWHENEGESVAMWEIYAKSDAGIAIQTTAGRLKDSLPRTNPSEPVMVAAVRYRDYEREMPYVESVSDALLFKRKAYEHEREVRAITIHTGPRILPEKTSGGKPIPVDIDVLIENIYVAPGTASWAKEAIQSVLDKFEVKKSVQNSQLSIPRWWDQLAEPES